MQKFIVNEVITLKLENRESNIYVKDKLFKQCKYLLLNLSVEDIRSFDEIESIDEAAEKLDKSLERTEENQLSPEEEFMAHCSNLQVWVENDYNTRLLHRNIAFPLLKALVDTGDITARRVFKTEIVKRIRSGCPSVISYLLQEYYTYFIEGVSFDVEYIFFLDVEEFEFLLYDLEENIRKQIKDALLKRIKYPGSKHEIKEKCFQFLKKFRYGPNLKYVEFNGEKFFVNNDELIIIITKDKKIENMNDLRGLLKLRNLKKLDLSGNNIKVINNLINLKNLRILKLIDNKIEEINGLEKLRNLRELFLSRNNIADIKGLESLKKLEYLSLSQNRIEEIKGLRGLTTLKNL